MASGYGWTQQCLYLLFIGTVIVLPSNAALKHERSTLGNALVYEEFLENIKEGAELLTLTRFSDLSSGPSSTIDVGFSSTTQVNDITDIFLFVIKISDDETSYQSYTQTMASVDSIPAQEVVRYKFPYNERLPVITDGDKVSLVVVARDASEKALAAGEFTFEFTSTSASMAWVGGPSDDTAAFLRVDTTVPSSIGSECPCDATKPCYCPQPKFLQPQDLEICVEVTGIGNANAKLTASQCDGGITPTAYKAISSIQSYELHTSDDSRVFEILATYDPTNSKKVDILFYQDEALPSAGTPQCNDLMNTCIVNDPPNKPTFNILLVALDDNDAVVESILFNFEDYSIYVNKLSPEAVEVTWSGSSSTDYEVILDDTNAAFTKTVGNRCEGEKCKAYFVKITSSTPKFTVYTTADQTMKSSRSLDMGADDPTQATFTSINKLNSSTISVDVTSESVISSDAVSLVVITVSDEEGIEGIYDGAKLNSYSSSDVKIEDYKYQFLIELQPFEGKPLHFILVGHQENYVTFAGTASGGIKELNTKLGWVGAANSQESNDATLRISTTDDIAFGDSCSCSNDNSPCYCIHTNLKEDALDVCSDLDDEVHYCDKSISVDQYKDFTSISKSRLLYPLESPAKSFEFEADVDGVSKYEILFLLGDDPLGENIINKCDNPSDSNKCRVSLSKLPETSQTYQVLAVALDSDDAIKHSKDFPFEDYKVTLQAITPELLLVNWESARDTTFNIACSTASDGDVPSPTNTRCETSCMIIRDGVTCGENLYTVDVKEKEGPNSKNLVAGQAKTLKCDLAELSISTPELRYDDHIRVCFRGLSNAHQYQLILAYVYEGVVIEAVFYDATQLDVDNERNSCLVGHRSLSLGSYVDLQAVVVAYGNDGNIIASGKINWEAILLSSDRWVQAAITDETTIISSWQVIDDSKGIDNIIITLRSDTGSKEEKIPSSQTSYKLTDIAAGSYSVCVRAVSSALQSEEVCSGIIIISENSDIDVPQRPETSTPKSSGKDSVMITWDQQENITAYMVSWRINSVLDQSKQLIPLNFLTMLLPIKNGGNDFKIIPASSSSFEISGLDKGAWDVCLSGVKDGNVGNENCQISDVDPDKFVKINATENLRIEKSVLIWDAIIGINNYSVEWQPHSSDDIGGYQEKSGTSFNLEEIISPGKWSFTVRAINDSQLGDPRTIIDTIRGIQINWYQVGSRSLLVEWEEMPNPETSSVTYKVSYHQEGDSKTIDVKCDFEVISSCQVYLLDIDIDTSKAVVLEIASEEEDTKREISIPMSNLKEITQLKQTMRSANQASVSWDEVDGSKCYNVSLYMDQKLLIQKWQTLPRSVTFDMPHLEGCNVTVQPCINNKRCMDGKQIQLKIVQDDSGDVDGLLLVSILGGVLGTAIVVSAIIVIVFKYKDSNRAVNVAQSSGDRARRVSTVSILGQSQLYNNVVNKDLRPSRQTYDEWRTQY